MPGIARKILAWALIVVAVSFASAQPAIQPTVDITKVPVAAQPSPDFGADAATEAYMAMMPPEAVARSNAYFEGGYWLILWGFFYASAVSLLLLNLRWSARMRDLAVRTTRFQWLQTLLYGLQYIVAATVLGFPLSTTRIMCANTNMDLQRKPLARGWATSSSRCSFRRSSVPSR